MSGAPVTGRPSRLNVGYGSWDLIWSFVHRVLVVNIGLAAANLPLLAALHLVDRPWRYPVFFGLLSLGIGPSLAAAFGYLRGADGDERAPAAELPRAYRRLFGRALLLWTPCVLLTAVAATDAYVLRHSALGLALVPLFAMAVLVAVGSGVAAMACLAYDAPRVRRRTLLAVSYAQVRRWPLGLMNLGLLAVALVLVNQAPLLGLAVVPGCVLSVVWRNFCSMAGTSSGPGAEGPGAEGPGAEAVG
ncbi:hypothetical protein [Streptomyces corynorhini]|uniref:DUF624 domain-containing protein n=1 Tax=Streptomyces corynorhini TaxID=2282652 RepID=A0A370B9W3_9ACTN|nr:hypothetical protein [Streptomyces corynorhini]RDG38421.1 hypothetical protein DVH02_09300 [Streptomyces corynorhini]